MPLEMGKTISCDVLVIGSGGAGLRAAIAAKSTGADVVMASKFNIGKTSNTYISKGVMATLGFGPPEDNIDQYIDDTLKVGRFLNDRAMVEAIARQQENETAFLQQCGAAFAMDGDKPMLLHIPGHQYPRHLVAANWKGSDIVFPLKHFAAKQGVVFEEHLFVSSILSSDGRVSGACGITTDGLFITILAPAVVLATGGYSQIFMNTNNVPGITGDGQALCYELGLPLKDMEFVQFYPTAMGRRGSRLLLNEKLLAQDGVSLKNQAGENIIKKYGFDDFLTVTRDLLAQIMMKETVKGIVVLDLTHMPSGIDKQLSHLLPASYWKGEKRFQVVPTAHFCMGGVITDDYGQTPLAGLFAAGEIAAGAHGANRLGGNSLSEIFSMGFISGSCAAAQTKTPQKSNVIKALADNERYRIDQQFSSRGTDPDELLSNLKQVMWHKAGILRHGPHLEQALQMLENPWPDIRVRTPAELIKSLELYNMRLIATAVCKAALMRTESRGSHFRTDFSTEDNDNWLKNIIIHKTESGMTCKVQSASSVLPD